MNRSHRFRISESIMIDEIPLYYNIYFEPIPKLKIESLNFKFQMTNRVSDHENNFETLINVRTILKKK